MTAPGTGPSGSSTENSDHDRSGSSGDNSQGGRQNDLDKILYPNGKNDPASAISTKSTSEDLLPDLAKLSISLGRPLDVEDLGGDEAGWRAAAKENRIKVLGDLGEGAGGAVTRCQLEGGNTVFALKVHLPPITYITTPTSSTPPPIAHQRPI